ncbi:MAG: hypothetical protein ACI37Q_00105 [Candidatus Gastranaerophilaceae bacterium]
MASNNEFLNNYSDSNECTSRGVCSISPAISALEELLLLFLEHAAYYILNLEFLGAKNEKIKYKIINTLSSLISVNEFTEKELYNLVNDGYYLLENTKSTYLKLCRELNKPTKQLKLPITFSHSLALSKAIAVGIKYSTIKNKSRSLEQKNFISVLLILLKSVSLNLSKLIDFNEFDDVAYHEILTTLNLFNSDKIRVEELKSKISKLSETDYNLHLKISDLLIKTFGEISEVSVSHSTRPGKAILVSGNNFFDLLNVLEKTKNENIDVYTHSNLLIVHALSNFKKYPNLRGHYGNQTENCILDFATFPGSILLTKNLRANREFFYRGRLFSTDYIVPSGIIKIENDDFSELIKSAKTAKGFSKGKIKPDTLLGYDEIKTSEELNNIVDKLNNGKIKKLYIVGINAHLTTQKIYFDEFFNNLNDDEFVISFSYSSEKKNVLVLNVGDYVPLVTGLLHKFFDKRNVSDEKIVFFFTTCDVMSISSIILLKNLGAKNIYMTQCLPTIISPNVFESFKKTYEIFNTTTPVNDLSNIRAL